MKKYCETVPKVLWKQQWKILWNSANKNNTVKVDFIPPITDYELGLCALSARGRGGSVYTMSLKRNSVSVVKSHIFSVDSCSKMWLTGIVLDWYAGDRWFKSARFYLYFCTRKATHVLSKVTLSDVSFMAQFQQGSPLDPRQCKCQIKHWLKRNWITVKIASVPPVRI